MICNECNWSGQQCELITSPQALDLEFLEINKWVYCPKCNSKMSGPLEITPTTVKSIYHNTVLDIDSEPNSNSNIIEDYLLMSRRRSSYTQTFLHLGRILAFTISPLHLQILGYKKYSNFPFNISIKLNFEFESIILLKIIHQAHLNHHKCTSRSINNLIRFGTWNNSQPSDYPLQPCSFCARFYDWENHINGTTPINSWPFSYDKIQRIKLDAIRKLANAPAHNNKFALIFSEQKQVESKEIPICICNEISPKPNPDCELHKILQPREPLPF